MILVGKETKKSTEQVLERAVDFFGPEGVGLEIVSRGENNVELRGGGGYVVVRTQPDADSGNLEVEIESREWEPDAEKFLSKI